MGNLFGIINWPSFWGALTGQSTRRLSTGHILENHQLDYLPKDHQQDIYWKISNLLRQQLLECHLLEDYQLKHLFEDYRQDIYLWIIPLTSY